MDQKEYQNSTLFGENNVAENTLATGWDTDYDREIDRILPYGKHQTEIRVNWNRNTKEIDPDATPRIFERPSLDDRSMLVPPTIEEYLSMQPINNKKIEKGIDTHGLLNDGIDALELIGSVVVSSLEGVAGGLAIANVSLYSELLRACNNPTEYMGWEGTWKILRNTAISTGLAIGLNKLATGIANKLPMDRYRKQVNGIFFSNKKTEVTKIVDRADKILTATEAAKITFSAVDHFNK
jgi:hypothetical protein